MLYLHWWLSPCFSFSVIYGEEDIPHAVSLAAKAVLITQLAKSRNSKSDNFF